MPDQNAPLSDKDGLHPGAPRHKSPVLWMGAVMVLLVVLTTATMWGKEKVSIKATVTIPELTPAGERGRAVFAQACQDCHGVDGSGGSRNGPPLIHPMYRADQYPDFVLKQVIRNGKREKNWRFGAMAPVENLTESQIDDVTTFIRAAQVASGIEG